MISTESLTAPDPFSSDESALAAEVHRILDRDSTIGPRLKRCVESLTVKMREAGHPPEHVVVAVKHVAVWAGASQVGDARERHDHGTTDVVKQAVEWCIQGYFDN